MQRSDSQRGAALLLAMIIVALVATLSVSMVWQQWRAVQVEAAERARAQSTWILAGALDFARLILREDMRGNGAKYDALDEPWALPLAEARLSTFLAADKDNNTDSGPEAFLSGDITDAQSRYNLTRLVNTDPKTRAGELTVFRRLCSNVGLSIQTASQIADKLNAAQSVVSPDAPRGTSGVPADTPIAVTEGPLKPDRISDLAWFGLAPDVVRRLEPYVALLPPGTKVNVNTASREVLAAVIPGLDLGTAERLVQYRQRSPFQALTDVQQQISGPTLSFDDLSVDSDFFFVRGRLRVGDQALEQRALVRRVRSNPPKVETLSREWTTTRDTATP